MNSTGPPPFSGSDSTPKSARTLGRNFTLRYVLSLALIAVLAILGQIVVQVSLRQQESDARIINLAGRQRMLSQRLAKAALWTEGTKRTKELKLSLSHFVRVHQGLVQGDESLGLPGRVSPVVAKYFELLDPHFRFMVDSVRALLAANGQQMEQARRQIAEHERLFMHGMDTIVFQLDLEARERVSWVKRFEFALLALTLAVLMLEALLVFRPAVCNMTDAVANVFRVRDSLARTEAEQQATLSAIPDALARMASDGRLILLKATQSVWFATDQASGSAIPVEAQPESLRAALADCREALRTGQVSLAQHVVVPADSPESAYELRVTRALGSGYIVMMRDISEQRRLEAEVLDATEQTQTRVGRELHDGLCQHLVGVALLARARADDPDRDEVVRLLEDGVAQARELALGLYPSTLANLGLQGALEELARHVETVSNLECVWEIAELKIEPSNDVALQLYRIAQEAAANVIKHADARKIILRLIANQATLTLEVEDDGKGFPAQGHRGRGLGLDTMRYRARLLNGDLTIVTPHSGGTLVRCSIALPKA